MGNKNLDLPCHQTQIPIDETTQKTQSLLIGTDS